MRGRKLNLSPFKGGAYGQGSLISLNNNVVITGGHNWTARKEAHHGVEIPEVFNSGMTLFTVSQ